MRAPHQLPRPRAGRGVAVTLASALTVVVATTAGCSPARESDDVAGPGVEDLANGAALDPWLATLRDAGSGRADVLLIGDSITEGYGTDWEGRPAAGLQRLLRQVRPVGGEVGEGYVPAANFAGLYPPLEVSGSPEPVNVYGPGRKAMAVAADQSLTYRGTFTAARVWFARDEGAGPGLVSVDGGEPEPLDDEEGSGGGRSWEVDELGPGEHTLTVTAQDGDLPLVVEAFEAWGSAQDRDSGVHVLDAAHAGFVSGAWVSGDPAADRAWESIRALDADVTVVNLGTNDRFWSVPAEDVADHVSEIADRAAEAVGDPDHPVLVLVPYQVPQQATGGGDDPEWEEIREALLGLAEENVAVLDLDAHWPDLTPDNGSQTGVMFEDTWPTHPNDAGHAAYARLLARALGAG